MNCLHIAQGSYNILIQSFILKSPLPFAIVLRNHLRQIEIRIQRKRLLPYAYFCYVPLAADEDSRLNLEQLGSLGSTSLLHFLPELLGTVTEDDKAGEDLPQQQKVQNQ